MSKDNRDEPKVALAPPQAAAPGLRLLPAELASWNDLEELPVFKPGSEPSTPMEILLVDDNPGDVRMIMEGLREALPGARLSVAEDGVEALQFLRREGPHHDARRPDLILLDLRMPKKSGFDVLGEIKQDPTLLNIPVVVQTSSEAEIDIHRAYGLHANCYVTKPASLDELERVIRVLAEFWTTVAKLPSDENEWKTN